MADWSASIPDLITSYTLVLVDLQARDTDAYTLAESPTNPPTGAIRYLRASDKFQEWNGITWVDKVLSLAGGGTGATTAAGVRASIGLGTMALQNNNAVTITGGTIAGLTTIGAPGAATGTWPFNAAAPQITLVNGTSNWIEWNVQGVGAPAFATRSLGTKLVIFPNIGGALTDFALGIESGAMWYSVPNDGASHFFYHGTTRSVQIAFAGASYSLPTLTLSPGIDSPGSRLAICNVVTGSAPAYLQSGEPGVNASFVLVSNNYRSVSTGACQRVNTSIGGSFIRLESGAIELVGVDTAGALSSLALFNPSSVTFSIAGTATFTIGTLSTASLANNTNTAGPILSVGRANSVPNGQGAGMLMLMDRNGGQWFLWVDAAGKLRIKNSLVTTILGDDTSGTVVGTQT